MTFPSLSFPSIGEIVEDRLEFLILAGVFRPDDLMPSERKLAEEFNVSRAAVRTALSRLRAKKLIKKTKSTHQVSVSIADDLVAKLSDAGTENPLELLRLWWFLLYDLRRFIVSRPTELDNQRIEEAVQLAIDTIKSNKVKKRFAALKELSIRLSEASYNFCCMQAMAACLVSAEPLLVSLLENLGANNKEVWVDQLSRLSVNGSQNTNINLHFFDDHRLHNFDHSVALPTTGSVEIANASAESVLALREYISNGDVAIGEALHPSRSLAEQLKISEDSLQHAIVELKALDVLAADAQGQIRLVSFTPKLPFDSLVESILAQPYAIESVFDFRISIECEIVASAARNATPQQLSKIEEIVNKMGEVCNTDYKEFARLDSAFHKLLAHSAERSCLSALYEGFAPILTKVTQHWLSKHRVRQGDNMRIHLQHVEIANAISTKNPTLATQVMRSHLEYVLTSLTEFERRTHFEQIAELRQHI
ncbi:FCD domain-containing protein [Maritalea porphyrae]|uniref:FCD domain-containing protein n=1 Tax=Maritalea porphyrae TaxID=880732 RepID=UPI0022AE9CDE|nr:FCD domain-containing protein [Maritalea porphyrae]MCZ4273404.1 GntR family transcriptional regulator [Maritalea porphyrae]